MPQAHRSMLSFFQLVADVPDYEEREMERPGAQVAEEGWGEDGDGSVVQAAPAADGFAVDFRDGRDVRRI